MQLSRTLLVLAILLLPAVASAYPEFQMSTGNARCSLCHYAPTGGGLVNDWGRLESSDTISRGGDGAFLHGLYDPPDWLALGGDLRLAGLVKEGESDPEKLIFPMQGDLYARLQAGDWSLYGTVGPRAQARPVEQPFASRIASREHYVMWKPKGESYYARAGRFLVPFGLRSQDHTRYTRRDLGLYVFNETYNLSAGIAKRAWEAHATAFVPVPSALEAASNEYGGAAFYERRLGDDETIVVAAQTKIGVSDDSERYFGGGYGKYWWEGPSLLFSGELDLGLERFTVEPGPSRAQLVSYLGASWWPTQGLMVTGAHERSDLDLSVEDTARDAFSLSLQLFPRAHWEIMATGKVELHGSSDRTTTLGLLQLHYYL